MAVKEHELQMVRCKISHDIELAKMAMENEAKIKIEAMRLQYEETRLRPEGKIQEYIAMMMDQLSIAQAERLELEKKLTVAKQREYDVKLKALEEEHVMEMDRFRMVTDSQIKLKNLEDEKDKNEKLLMVVATITEHSEKQAEIIETLSTDMKTLLSFKSQVIEDVEDIRKRLSNVDFKLNSLETCNSIIPPTFLICPKLKLERLN
jgi:hypothetical protein